MIIFLIHIELLLYFVPFAVTNMYKVKQLIVLHFMLFLCSRKFGRSEFCPFQRKYIVQNSKHFQLEILYKFNGALFKVYKKRSFSIDINYFNLQLLQTN